MKRHLIYLLAIGILSSNAIAENNCRLHIEENRSRGIPSSFNHHVKKLARSKGYELIDNKLQLKHGDLVFTNIFSFPNITPVSTNIDLPGHETRLCGFRRAESWICNYISSVEYDVDIHIARAVRQDFYKKTLFGKRELVRTEIKISDVIDSLYVRFTDYGLERDFRDGKKYVWAGYVHEGGADSSGRILDKNAPFVLSKAYNSFVYYLLEQIPNCGKLN